MKNVMNVTNECGNVEMWKCENESRIRGFRGYSSEKLINNLSFFH